MKFTNLVTARGIIQGQSVPQKMAEEDKRKRQDLKKNPPSSVKNYSSLIAFSFFFRLLSLVLHQRPAVVVDRSFPLSSSFLKNL